MSAPSETGPFRRDARIERTAEVETPAVAWDVLQRRALFGVDIPGYYAILGLATLAMGLAFGRSVPAIVAAVLLLGIALWLGKQWMDIRRRISTEPSDVRRCAFTSDAILLESSRGRTAWPYAAIRSIRRREQWLILAMSDQQALVLRAEGEPGTSLTSWVAARATHLSNEPSRTHTLLLLAILYVVIAAAIVVIMPAYITP